MTDETKNQQPDNGGSRCLDTKVSPRVYELNTFQDLLEIPFEKLPKALEEFSAAMLQSKMLYDIAKIAGAEKESGIELPLKWIDDDKGEITTTVQISKKEG